MHRELTAARSLREPQNNRQIGALARLRWLSSVVVLGLLGLAVQAQTPKPNASQVQAAYLYNFGKFVKWPAITPANQNENFIICVLDQDLLGDTLKSTLARETVAGKPVAVKRLTKVQDAGACHILFIGATDERTLPGILSSLGDASILTVSDMPDFSERGGMIQFVLENDRIRFEINLEGAEKSHLVFSSDLLKVAVAVRRPMRSGE